MSGEPKHPHRKAEEASAAGPGGDDDGIMMAGRQPTEADEKHNNIGRGGSTTSNNLYRRAVESVVEDFRHRLGQGGETLSLTECGLLDNPCSLAGAIQARLEREDASLEPLRRAGPSLKLASDALAMAALFTGLVDPVAVAAAWATVRFLVRCVDDAAQRVAGVATAVEQLGLALPQLRAYADVLLPAAAVTAPRLEALLGDIYREALGFLARALRFVARSPRVMLRRAAWDRLKAEGAVVVRNVRHWTAAVEIESQATSALRSAAPHGDVMAAATLLRGAGSSKVSSSCGRREREEEELADRGKDDDNEPATSAVPRRQRFHRVPLTLSPRFSGRHDVLDAMEKGLRPGEKATQLQSLVLFGIGGVGKTQAALRYVELHRERYDAILWVEARSLVTASDCFREIARAAGLVESALEAGDTAYVTLRVKAWLAGWQRPWLLVMDGADDLVALSDLWPASGACCGHVLVTTRDHTGAHPHGGVQSALHVRPMDADEGAKCLLDALGLVGAASGGSSPAQVAAARDISSRFGGLPLALSQAAGFMARRRLPLGDFLPAYELDPAGIDACKSSPDHYEHCVASVWRTTLFRLSGEQLSLVGLLACLDTEGGVEEEVLFRGIPSMLQTQQQQRRRRRRQKHQQAIDMDGAIPYFAFPADDKKTGLARALDSLLRLGIIYRDPGTRLTTMHRLIQTAVIRIQTIGQRARFFDLAARVVRQGFPDRWTQDKGHQFRLHGRSARYLPHAYRLRALRERAGDAAPPVGDVQAYGEVLLGAAWYLFELERLTQARDVARAALDVLRSDAPSLACAGALDLNGLVALDLGEPAEALRLFQDAREIRRGLPSILTASSPLIGLSHNNIGRALTHLGRLTEAHRQLGLGLEVRLLSDRTPVRDADDRDDEDRDDNGDNNPTDADDHAYRLGNSYGNLASCLLRMGKPDEAEAALRRCPALRTAGGCLTDDSFIRNGNPRLLGDMVLLSRIRLAQGRPDSAQWLSSCALAHRRRVLGACLKTADATYDVVRLMLLHGNYETAFELAQELEKLAATIPPLEGAAQRARISYLMSVIHDKSGRPAAARDCRVVAERLRADLRPDLAAAPFNEEEFDKLCPWMLW